MSLNKYFLVEEVKQMPIYEYECKDCENVFEVQQRPAVHVVFFADHRIQQAQLRVAVGHHVARPIIGRRHPLRLGGKQRRQFDITCVDPQQIRVFAVNRLLQAQTEWLMRALERC